MQIRVSALHLTGDRPLAGFSIESSAIRIVIWAIVRFERLSPKFPAQWLTSRRCLMDVSFVHLRVCFGKRGDIQYFIEGRGDCISCQYTSS